MTKTKSLYLPNLNAFRFIAASAVMIHHIEYTKLELNLPNCWSQQVWGLIGDLGVTLFFTLSGFLITILLLKEKKETGTINIVAFYKRRILRIWPLYYLIFFLALFILPYIPFFNLPSSFSAKEDVIIKLLLFIFMLPNVIFSFYPRLPYAVQTWSIGVEEQFYLIWPWLIKKTKNTIQVLLIIYVGFIFLMLILETNIVASNIPDQIIHLIFHLRFGCMAIGGVAASLYFYEKKKILNYILNLKAQLFGIIALSVLFLLSQKFLMHELFALFFALIILNFAFCLKVLVNLEREPFKYLGKISYGIYMYQFVATAISIKSVNYFIGFERTVLSNSIIYLTTFGLTITLASLSYEFYEKRFIKLKQKFQIILSNS